MAKRMDHQKNFDLSCTEDQLAVLRILEESDLEDFSDDDDISDPTWIYEPRTIETITELAEDDEPETTEDTEFEEQVQSKPAAVAERLIWRTSSFTGIPIPEEANIGDKLPGSTISYFNKYFISQHFESAAMFTNMYALFKHGKELSTTSVEIKQLYGAHLLMGCIPYPRLRWYWRNGFRMELLTSVFSRDRFILLRNCLHYVDAALPNDVENKLWKVQPIINAVRNHCREIKRIVGPYSIDEQMIPFTGRCSLRQYVKGKPRPVGLKNFVVATSGGMVMDFEIYQGTNTPFSDRSLGLGPAVILRLTETLPTGSFLFFDRYFTTVPLLGKLKELGFYASGTIMTNRLKNIKFNNDRNMKRGDMQEFSSNHEIVAVKWRDTKSVVMLSTAVGKEPVENVSRWCKKSKNFIDVPCPAVVRNYNKFMGGVDVCDQMIEYYRTFIKTKKWTLKVALHFLDLALVNSWQEYRQDCTFSKVPKNRVKDLLEFRLEVAEALLATVVDPPNQGSDNEVETPQPKRPKNYCSPLPVDAKRHDGTNHWPVCDDLDTARKCRLHGCKSRTRFRCKKCDIYLCITKYNNCFEQFHCK